MRVVPQWLLIDILKQLLVGDGQPRHSLAPGLVDEYIQADSRAYNRGYPVAREINDGRAGITTVTISNDNGRGDVSGVRGKRLNLDRVIALEPGWGRQQRNIMNVTFSCRVCSADWVR